MSKRQRNAETSKATITSGLLKRFSNQFDIKNSRLDNTVVVWEPSCFGPSVKNELQSSRLNIAVMLTFFCFIESLPITYDHILMHTLVALPH